jgi:hypothetical protein
VVGRHVPDEVDAVDVLHREEPPLAPREELVELDEVRVHDVGERAELALEAIERVRVGAQQRLERHARVALGVEHLPDDAERPLAEATPEEEPRRSIVDVREIVAWHARSSLSA